MALFFAKLAQLFLKHYVGQQNMSAGCQCVTFVLKHRHCSLPVSFCLSFANSLFFLMPSWWRVLLQQTLEFLPAACQSPLLLPMTPSQQGPSALFPVPGNLPAVLVSHHPLVAVVLVGEERVSSISLRPEASQGVLSPVLPDTNLFFISIRVSWSLQKP